MPYSPLGVANTTLGHRHDLLESAMGRAYLIACDPAERRSLVLLLKSNAPQSAAYKGVLLLALATSAALALFNSFDSGLFSVPLSGIGLGALTVTCAALFCGRSGRLRSPFWT